MVNDKIKNGEFVTDLCYEEDSRADSDFNIVMGKNKGILELVEIQGSAEGKRFSRQSFDSVLDVATKGVSELISDVKFHCPSSST